jgi:hypothetical protein
MCELSNREIDAAGDRRSRRSTQQKIDAAVKVSDEICAKRSGH